MDHKTRGDLESSVDDLGLASKDLALDFRDCLRGISTDWTPRAGLLRRPYLRVSERIDRIHCADVPVVERDGVVDEEVDLLQLLRLDVKDSVRERVELAGVVPVTVSNNDPGNSSGIQPDVFHLVGEVPPAARGVPVKYVLQLLPAAVIQGDLAVLPFDDADIGRKVNEGDVVSGVCAAGDICPVRHESTGRLVHEPAALDEPGGVKGRVPGFFLIAQKFAGTLEALRQCLRR